jgi:DNA (cytosine-5)-methyltransferase 1
MMSLRSDTEGKVLRQLRLESGLTQAELARIAGYHVRHVKRWEAGEFTPRPAVLELLRNAKAAKKRNRSGCDFTFLDLFAGIGGLRLAFESAGGRCVFTSEWDSWCQKTYRDNFGFEDIHGDITNVDAASIPDHDILLAGFPCQPFSIAGVSKKNSLGRAHGFACNTQGTLFFDVERIIARKRPKAFLLENVKNLVSHDGGRTYAVIMDVLKEKLGYHVFPRIVDSMVFVPQHRERIFLVGFRDSVPFDWQDVTWPSKARRPTLGSILHPENGTEVGELPYTDANGMVDPRYTLSDRLWKYLQDYARKHQARGNGFGFGLFGPEDVARTLSARYYKDGSEVLIRQEGRNPRRLTPRECARLMGFDRDGRRFRIPVSDTRAYKQFGNSVVVPVIERIAQAMKPFVVGGERFFSRGSTSAGARRRRVHSAHG